MKKVKYWLAAAGLAVTLAAPAATAAYPDAPVKFIVGFSPGSTIDLVARILGDALAARTGQTFVVENRTGANGMIAARSVAQAKPDGYTILVSNSSSITVNPLLYKDLGYHPLKDFEPVSTVVEVPFVLTINPQNERLSKVSSVADLVAQARSKPGSISYGSAGNGNLMHLAGAQLATMADVQMLHVPYRGAAPMEAGLLAKEVDFGFDTLSGVPLIQSGKLKALAVSTKERWKDLPEVPSVAELGYPDFDISFWVGVFAPAGTPAEVVEKLNQDIVAVVADPQVRQRLQAQGRPSTPAPDEFRAKIAGELKKNEALIQRANIKVD